MLRLSHAIRNGRYLSFRYESAIRNGRYQGLGLDALVIARNKEQMDAPAFARD